ncbi:SRPBCC domain-containing protein [Uliginosibacterium sp. sgz301328]|uniref:SRPBCC family protein n=1 Tax=Uliginosibacterium sp. sgz301328 TaxID=3243764 RepID=UPI00359CD6AF
MSASPLHESVHDGKTETHVVLTPPSHHEIVIARVLEAPRELVFRAWTDPRQLAQWWGPHGFICADSHVDLRPGGRFRLDMQGPDGLAYPCEGIYHEITPPERIVLGGMLDDRDACGCGIPPNGRVTITFAALAERLTRLTITARLPSRESCDIVVQHGFGLGWSQALERLEAQLARAQ